jgi:hypothetical protein
MSVGKKRMLDGLISTHYRIGSICVALRCTRVAKLRQVQSLSLSCADLCAVLQCNSHNVNESLDHF